MITDEPAAELQFTTYEPALVPGARAPHLWLDLATARVSTLDLVGPWFTLVTADHLSEITQVPVVQIPELAAAYGLERHQAVIIRPDGHVAWRGPAESTAATRALTALLSATTATKVTEPQD